MVYTYGKYYTGVLDIDANLTDWHVDNLIGTDVREVTMALSEYRGFTCKGDIKEFVPGMTVYFSTKDIPYPLCEAVLLQAKDNLGKIDALVTVITGSFTGADKIYKRPAVDYILIGTDVEEKQIDPTKYKTFLTKGNIKDFSYGIDLFFDSTDYGYPACYGPLLNAVLFGDDIKVIFELIEGIFDQTILNVYKIVYQKDGIGWDNDPYLLQRFDEFDFSNDYIHHPIDKKGKNGKLATYGLKPRLETSQYSASVPKNNSSTYNKAKNTFKRFA